MASPIFYFGLVLVVVGSWIGCVLMLVAMSQWKRANPGAAVPLAMYAAVDNAVMIAGRLRGGRGLFGWIPALPWERAAHRLRERGSAQRYGISAKLRKDEIEKIAEYYAAVRLFRPQD